MDAHLYHVITGGTTATVPEPGPGPDPGVPELPAGPPLAWRGDFLTFQPYGDTYYLGDQDADAEMCRLYRERGYTEAFVGTVQPEKGHELDSASPPYNFIASGPDSYVKRATGYTNQGLRVICVLGFEDAPKTWQKHKPTWLKDLRAFVKGVDAAVSCYMLGVEVEEFWTWDEMLATMEVIAGESDKPIAVHFTQTIWGPEGHEAPWMWHGGGEQMRWWGEAQKRCPGTALACAFQHRHDQKAHQRPNGGFLSPESDFHDHIPALTDKSRLGGIGVELISAEYGYGGSDLSHPSVAEHETVKLGELAMELGAYGFLNGG